MRRQHEYITWDAVNKYERHVNGKSEPLPDCADLRNELATWDIQKAGWVTRNGCIVSQFIFRPGFWKRLFG